jgi:hypothetical protein
MNFIPFLLKHFYCLDISIGSIFISIALIDTTLLEEKDARLEFSWTKAPRKNLYLKLVGGYKGAMETWKCQNY